MTYDKDSIEFVAHPSSPRFTNLTAQVFTRLTVLGYAGIFLPDRSHQWWCECKCGTIKPVRASRLLNKETQSCKCLVRETGRILRETEFTHTLQPFSKRLKNIWNLMKARCYKPQCPEFKHYGDRGILMCDAWLYFDNFVTDMGEPPTSKHSIERLDNNKGYQPDNCIWATQVQQMNNTRRNHFLTFQNKTQTLKQWSRELNLNYGTLIGRLKLGWSIEDALTAPLSPPQFKKHRCYIATVLDTS